MFAKLGPYGFPFGFGDIVLVRFEVKFQSFFKITFNLFIIHSDEIFRIHSVAKFAVCLFLFSLSAYINGILHPFDKRLKLVFVLCPVLIDNGNCFGFAYLVDP